MNQKNNKIPENPVEETVVKATTLVVGLGVGLVVKEVVRSVVKESVMNNKTTRFLFLVGEMAISGVITDVATKKYEKHIRSFFKNAMKATEEVQEKEKDDKQKTNT